MKTVWFGFFEYFRGLKYSFAEKKLRRYLVGLGLLNFIFFILTISGLISHIDVLLQSHLPATDTFLHKIYYGFAYFTAIIATFIVSAFLVYFFSNFVLGVIYGDLLSKKFFELRSFNVAPIQRTLWQNIEHISEKFFKILLILCLTVFSFFLALLPGLGLVGLYLGALVLSFDMMDYGFDVSGLTVKERFAFFKSNMAAFLGFSLGLVIVMAVPVVNVLLVPSSIVAASHLFVELKTRRKIS